MKVLYVVSASHLKGGASIALLNIILELKNIVDICVFFPSKGDFSSFLEARSITCFYSDISYSLSIFSDSDNFFIRNIKNAVSLFRRNFAMYCLDRVVKQYRPDIIHTNVGPLDIGYEIAKKNGITHVWHLREFIDTDFGLKPMPSMKSLISKYRDNNNYNIVITKAVQFHFYPLVNSEVVYDGVLPSEDMSDMAKDDYILFVGRLEEAKGILPLIKEFLIYAKEYDKYNLLIAGEGCEDYMNQCKELSNNSERIKFLGFRNDVYDLMSKAVALFVPSYSEGFGFISVEAMYNHCLVVGRDRGGIKEQFDRGKDLKGTEIGIRFNNDNEIHQIIRKLECLDTRKMRDVAYEVVTELYTKRKNAEEVKKIYDKVLRS